MTIKTSETDPIRVDFVPTDGVPGRLGLTFAPGKHQDGMEGEWRRDLDADLARLRDEYDADVLVCLLERHEMKQYRIAALPKRAWANGLEFWWLPIRDAGVPEPRAGAQLVHRIVDALAQGRTVVVHCRGGLGRTGTIAAGCLVALGARPDAAVSQVRLARKDAVETEGQVQFVRDIPGLLRGGGEGAAHGASWTREELPALRARLAVQCRLTREEFAVVRRGHCPGPMEDKWFVYWEVPWLHFHRSWTGFEVFRACFAPDGDGWNLVEAWVNRDPEQYTEESDEFDASLLRWLIRGFLLEQEIEFPIHPAGALGAWSTAGPPAVPDPDALEREAAATSTVLFSNADAAYEAWLAEHSDGYVFNHFGGDDPEMNVVHRSSCRTLHRDADAGRRTAVPKVCGEVLAEVVATANAVAPAGWRRCGVCLVEE